MKSLPASFGDGRNPGRQAARVIVTKQGLIVRGGDNLMLTQWGFGDLASAVDGLRHLDVRCASEPKASLHIRHAKPLVKILKRRTRLSIKPSLPKLLLLVAGGLVGFALTLAALWLLVMLLARPLAGLVPNALLTSWSRPMLENMGQACSSMPGQAALDGLASRLARAANVGRPVNVIVVDTPGIDTLALPDGQIVLSRGLLKEMRTPNEMAAVLAHQVAHIKLRTSAAAAIRGFGTISVSPSDEADAAQQAPAILAKAGIGNDGQISLFGRISAKLSNAGKSTARFPKPPPGAETASSWPALTEPDWDFVRRLCGR